DQRIRGSVERRALIVADFFDVFRRDALAMVGILRTVWLLGHSSAEDSAYRPRVGDAQDFFRFFLRGGVLSSPSTVGKGHSRSSPVSLSADSPGFSWLACSVAAAACLP